MKRTEDWSDLWAESWSKNRDQHLELQVYRTDIPSGVPSDVEAIRLLVLVLLGKESREEKCLQKI